MTRAVAISRDVSLMERAFSGLVLAAALLCASTLGGAAAAPTLREHKEINESLAMIAAADMIRLNCDSISPRMFQAYLFARSLQSKARAEGFSDDEIEAFVTNKQDKARVKGMAKDYLVSQGVKDGEPETYCKVGRYEIERNSQIGVMLRAK